jgi:hypothetical protein
MHRGSIHQVLNWITQLLPRLLYLKNILVKVAMNYLS